jgi:hypothetical protein
MKGRRVFVIPGCLRDRDPSLGMKRAPKECDQAVKAKKQGRRAVNGQIRPLALRFDPQVRGSQVIHNYNSALRPQYCSFSTWSKTVASNSLLNRSFLFHAKVLFP